MRLDDGWAWRAGGSALDRDQALALLPEDYRIALRLRDAGRPVAEIAARVGVDEEVVTTLLEIGDGKLRRILGAEPPPTGEDHRNR